MPSNSKETIVVRKSCFV